MVGGERRRRRRRRGGRRKTQRINDYSYLQITLYMRPLPSA
jgi:hypothetical protein